MWKPPQRIRFTAERGTVPTRDEAARSRLFSPVQVGPLALESRTWVPAMVPWRAHRGRRRHRRVVEWYGRFARGRPGAIVVEATGIRDVPSGPLLRIGDDRFLPGLRRIVETVRRASGGHTLLFIQLIDFLAIRRRPDPQKLFRRVSGADRTATARRWAISPTPSCAPASPRCRAPSSNACSIGARARGARLSARASA